MRQTPLFCLRAHRALSTFSLLLLGILNGATLSAQPPICGNRPAGMCADSIGTPGSTQPHDSHASPQIVTFQQLQHVVPKKALKEMEKADAARAKNRKDEELAHLSNAIQLDPGFVAARNNLATLYIQLNNPEPAIAQLEEALKLDPHNPTLFTNLTIGYTVMGQFEAAERAARTTVDLNRGSVLPRLLLGSALVYQRKFTDEAVKCLTGLGDEYPIAHLLLARILIARNELAPAKTEIQTYLSFKDQEDVPTAKAWLDVIDKMQQETVAGLPR
jgi:tetratricopeptide (TPR) repeat protein